jgi:hypothetical protein
MAKRQDPDRPETPVLDELQRLWCAYVEFRNHNSMALLREIDAVYGYKRAVGPRQAVRDCDRAGLGGTTRQVRRLMRILKFIDDVDTQRGPLSPALDKSRLRKLLAQPRRLTVVADDKLVHTSRRHARPKPEAISLSTLGEIAEHCETRRQFETALAVVENEGITILRRRWRG